MRILVFVTLVTMFQGTTIFCQTVQNDFSELTGPYLGQKPPGIIAVQFAKQIITLEPHDSPVISSDETEIFFPSFQGLKYFKIINGSWSSPKSLPFPVPSNFNGMHLSP